jgi:hypothetical protein
VITFIYCSHGNRRLYKLTSLVISSLNKACIRKGTNVRERYFPVNLLKLLFRTSTISTETQLGIIIIQVKNKHTFLAYTVVFSLTRVQMGLLHLHVGQGRPKRHHSTTTVCQEMTEVKIFLLHWTLDLS